MKNKKLFKKIILIVLAVIVLGGVIIGSVYYYQNKKQTNVPIKNQQENQIQDESTNEINNSESTDNKQENIESGNQNNNANGSQQTVPEGWQNYSYSNNGFYLSFNYPPEIEYSYSKMRPPIQEEWTVNENNNEVIVKGSLYGSNQYRFIFSQEQNAEEFIINTLEESSQSLGHTYEKITFNNGLSGYKSVFDNGEAHRYVYYLFKGNKILQILDYFNNWFDPTEQVIDIDNTLLNSINFN